MHRERKERWLCARERGRVELMGKADQAAHGGDLEEMKELAQDASAIVAWWMNESNAPPHVLEALKLQRMADSAFGKISGREEQHARAMGVIDERVADARKRAGL